MDQLNLNPFLRSESQRTQYLANTQEFGQRHANWRQLWTKLSQPSQCRLTDLELMHSLLCLVLPDNEDNEELASILIGRHGNFANAISVQLHDREYVGPLPYSAAVAFKIVHVAAQRLVEREITDRPKLTGQKHLKEYLIRIMKHKTIEQLRVIFLDASNRRLADELLAEGISSQVRFDHIDVVRRALNWGAAKIVLARNVRDNIRAHDEETLAGIVRLCNLCVGLNLNFIDYFAVDQNTIYSLRSKQLP